MKCLVESQSKMELIRNRCTSLEVLNEWINTKNEEKITAVGLLVKEAPSDFVFSHSDFVSNLLTNAQAISDDCYKEVRSNLLKSVEHGGRTGLMVNQVVKIKRFVIELKNLWRNVIRLDHLLGISTNGSLKKPKNQ